MFKRWLTYETRDGAKVFVNKRIGVCDEAISCMNAGTEVTFNLIDSTDIDYILVRLSTIAKKWVMPTFTLRTNVSSDRIPVDFDKKTVELVAKTLSKPKSYVVVNIQADQKMNWG